MARACFKEGTDTDSNINEGVYVEMNRGRRIQKKEGKFDRELYMVGECKSR